MLISLLIAIGLVCGAALISFVLGVVEQWLLNDPIREIFVILGMSTIILWIAIYLAFR